MFVVRKDIFLITLIQDISKWYDKWYKGNLVAMKKLHINTLLSNYDPDRFKKCNNLCEERKKFLAEIQETVNISTSFGEDSLWVN
jgi:hypothetical protein